jgi:diguanylate cyclase (GGDEF)-like protein
MPSNSSRHGFLKMLAVLLFLSLAWGETVASEDLSERPVARDGIIDLTDYSLGKSEFLPLNGEWLFLFDEFADPGQPFPRQRAHIVPVPDSWSNYPVGDGNAPIFGYASYYLELKLPESVIGEVALDVPNIGPGYTLYVNGQLVNKLGERGSSKSTSVPQYGPAVISLPEGAQSVELLFHMSNFRYHWAGIWYPVNLGFEETVQKHRNSTIQWGFFVAGVFAVIALFHFVFWLMRRNDWLSLTYVAVTLLALIRVVSTDETIILQLFPNMPFWLLMKLEYGAFYLLISASMLFMRLAFPAEVNRRLSSAIIALGAAGGLFVAVTPALWFVEFVGFYQLVSLLAISFFVHISIKAIKNKRDGAKFIVFGGTVFFGFILNDLLYARYLIDTGYFIDIGLCGFILSQSILINSRFAKTSALNKKLLGDVEKRNIALNDLTYNLESKVQQRTQELESAMEEIKTLALTDELTGLANRRAFLQVSQFEQSQAERYNGKFSIGLIDIDNFKSVNDTFGHDAGDEVLRSIARTIEEATRAQDKVARWGGEEFIILLTKTSMDSVREVLERVRRLVAETPVHVGNETIQPTITIGVAGSEEKATIDEIIQLADTRLYSGKNHGKNQVCLAADNVPTTY